MAKRNTIYYEFWKNGSLVSTGLRTFGSTEITTGIDTVPTLTLTIPLQDLPEENMIAYDVRVYFQVRGVTKYKFIGIVDNMSISYANYSVTLNLSHRVSRMREWLMPVNYTVKNTSVSHIIGPNGIGLGRQDTAWVSGTTGETVYDMSVEFEIQDDTTVEMTFSSDNKLAALTELINNTEDLHWMVDLSDNEGDKIIIGKFGQQQNVFISPNPLFDDECASEPDYYVTLLTEPVYNVDYTNHYNRAVVFCGDLGEGVLHLTLKEMYEHPDLWEAGFPIGLYDKEIDLQPEPEYDSEHHKINNEKIYKDNEVVAYANNINTEYYVTDQQQLAEDGGVVRHTTMNFSNLYPIPKLSETDENGNEIEYQITDEDRLEMGKRAYLKAIRGLKEQRPEHVYQFNCTALPVNATEGSKVNFSFTKKVNAEDEFCGGEENKKRTIVNFNEWLYITRKVIIFDEVMNEKTTLTLDRELRPRAVDAVEIELSKKMAESTSSSTWTDKPKSSFSHKWDNNEDYRNSSYRNYDIDI